MGRGWEGKINKSEASTISEVSAVKKEIKSELIQGVEGTSELRSVRKQGAIHEHIWGDRVPCSRSEVRAS